MLSVTPRSCILTSIRINCATPFRWWSVAVIHREVSMSAKGRDQDPDARDDGASQPKHSKGNSFENKDRRRGRPAYLRSPDDTPLRDANRDFMLGVITARACRTLVVYLQETNLNVAHWLVKFMQANPITLTGTWEDISGDTFLRKLLSMPIEAADYDIGREDLFDIASSSGVDPRNIAQRVLQIRYEIAKELIQDLQLVPEDNNTLLRQSLTASLENIFVKSSTEEEVTVAPSKGTQTDAESSDAS